MHHEEIPAWSASASESLGLLYRDLQPIEIYVEDSNSEVFYLELLNRMMGEGQLIRKVVPLHGRSHVLKVCDDYKFDSPAIFLIDGDLDLLLGERVKGRNNLYQLRAYCIENYLICLSAARELLVESSGLVAREHIISEEEWSALLQSVEVVLKRLFIVFAAARLAKPDLKTVGHGISSIITQRSRASGPELDPAKAKQLMDSIIEECIRMVGAKEWSKLLLQVESLANGLEAIDAVSGKDFILPLMTHFIRSKGCGNISSASLMFRLAKHCSLARLEELKYFLNEVLSGRGFVSV